MIVLVDCVFLYLVVVFPCFSILGLPGVTVRLSVDNIGDVAFGRQRDFFDAPRDIGQLAAVETREKQNGPAAFLTFRGTF